MLDNNIAMLGHDYYNFKHCIEKCFAKGVTDQTIVTLFQCPRLYGYPVFYVSLFPLSSYFKTNIGKE